MLKKACQLFECRSCEVYEILLCEQEDPDCQAADCDTMVLFRAWCPTHEKQMIDNFELQMVRKPVLRLEQKRPP